MLQTSLDASQLIAIATDFISPEKTQAIYKAWAVSLYGGVSDAFKGERSPAGSQWQPLNPKYLARKLKNKRARYGGKILKFTGTMFDSIAAQVKSDGVEMTTNVRVGNYSLGAIHQYGAPRRNIPARPFFPLNTGGEILPETIAELTDIAKSMLARG